MKKPIFLAIIAGAVNALCFYTGTRVIMGGITQSDRKDGSLIQTLFLGIVFAIVLGILSSFVMYLVNKKRGAAQFALFLAISSIVYWGSYLCLIYGSVPNADLGDGMVVVAMIYTYSSIRVLISVVLLIIIGIREYNADKKQYPVIGETMKRP